MLILVLTLLALTLSPLAGETGAAQGDGQPDGTCEEGFTFDEATGECVEAPPDPPLECDEGFVLDESTGECVPTDAPLECDEGFVPDESLGECVPIDEPLECDEGFVPDESLGECVEDPSRSLIPAADEPRQLAINKFFCPAGYEVTNRSAAQLIGDCTETAVSVEFTVSDGGGGYSRTQQSTSGDAGGAIFTDVPSGNSINVTETIPEGYGTPIVFCHGENTEGTIVQPAQDMIVENGRVYIDNREVFLTLCTWFNMSTLEPAADGAGTVRINKRACPATYDASARDMYEMAAECNEDAGVVNFSVFEYGGGGYDGGVKPTSGGPGPNLVTFENVPNVKLTIYEETVAGYTDAVVFCRVETELGDNVRPSAYIAPEGGFNTIPIEAPGEGNSIWCEWYNLPPYEPGDGNTVTVYKWICPEGTVYDQNLAWYEANCTEYADDIRFTLSSTDGSTTRPTGNTGQYQWVDVPEGPISIQEPIPDGYGAPVVFCGFSTNEGDAPVAMTPAGFERYDAPTGSIGYEIPEPSNHNFYCQWFNIPGDGNTVTVYKWICPEGTVYDQELAWYETNCTEYSDDVSFTLSTVGGTSTTTPDTGQYQWDNVPEGPIAIQETITYEYGAPVVFCGFFNPASGAPLTQTGMPLERYDAPTGYVSHEILEPVGYAFYCQWFNIPGEPGEITIYKWTCPEGYDLYAYGADPMQDCQDATNGVTFYLDPPNPGDLNLQTDTGDSIDGAVYFGGLEPGRYVVSEEVPADTSYVFVFDCFGTRDGKVHPYPLSFGDTLNVEVFGGDQIVCHWYNVPEYENGKITLVKYLCATKTFKSEVDCQIYEDGAEFDLTSGGTVVDTKTTDDFGKIIWIDIEPGDYWLDEKDNEWCAIGSTQLSADKESFAVERGEETIVKVYNCTSSATPGGKTGKQPTKYPNTGIGPVTDGGGAGPSELPAVAPLLGLGLLFTRLRSLSSGAARRVSRAREAGTSRMRLPHLVAMGAALPLIALLTFGPVMAQTGTPGAEDSEGAGTPTAQLCLPAAAGTPDAGDDLAEPTESADIAIVDDAGDDEGEAEEDTCVRGAVPARIAIEAIDVDAEVEILETVAGVMEEPTGAEDVAWYKETARLGEPGNIVMAGHLNYWGVPEGVFFSLGTLRAGDTVELTGDDGEVLSYRVEWVRQEDATQPPSDDVLASNGVESLTLITCGGEWDASISEFNERTVARAVRVADDAPDAGS